MRIYFEFRWSLKKTLTSHLTFLVLNPISTLENASFDFFCLFARKEENKELKSASLFSPLFDLFYPFFCGRAALCLRLSTRILSKCGLNCMCLRCLISHLLLSRSPWNLHSHPLQDVSVRAARPQTSNSAFFIWITSFVFILRSFDFLYTTRLDLFVLWSDLRLALAYDPSLACLPSIGTASSWVHLVQ